MSQLSADRDEGLDRKQLNLIRKRFLQVNRERLERLRSAARDREADIVDLLPMLWHVNHPVLPGWIDYDTPHSISDYTPTQATLIAAKKVAKAFEYERKAALRRDIYALFLMGSTGSLGHSGQSDLDVWLIHHPELSTEHVASLAEKAKRISHYAQQNDVALHVYLLTEDAVRSGQFGQMSQEHSGSTQHMLLLDEFYRSAVLLAGRLPLWWLVPPEAHHQYEQYADRLITQRFVKSGEYVDFGNVTDIPIHEFFTGSLWQLNKSLDAPYKSVLKLSLMEAYAHTPAPPPLSLTFKERIYHSRTSVVDLDPYLLIYRCVEQHLLRQGDTLRLEIIRRALYLKTGIKLSQTPVGEDWQRELLHNLVREWGWPRPTLLALDNRRHWKIETVIFERQQLSEVLNHSAKALQGFARSNADIAGQNQQELTLLNRKLIATLEKRAGKIERLNLNIAPDVSESALTIIVERDIGCSLARGLHDAQHASAQASLKRSHTLTELLAWAHANGLLMRRTRLALVSTNLDLCLAESATIARDIIDSFPAPLPLASNLALQSNATLVQMAVFINVGFDPMADLSRQGLHLVSDRTDALCYGSSHELLVQHIEIVWLNSWGELLTANFGGVEAIPQLLLKLHALTENNIERARVQCFCASPTRGPSIALRLQQLLQYFVQDILPMAKHSPLRFLLRLGKAFAEVQFDEQERQMRIAESLPTLMSWLAEPLPPACELIFEREMSADFDFDMIYLQRRQGSIQLFFRRVLDRIDVFVLDEADALVLCQYIATETKHLLSAWRSFLSTVSDRRRSLLGLPSHPSIECFEILPMGKLNHERIRRVEFLPSMLERQSISVVASTRVNQPISNELVIIINQQEFSALENGSAYLRLAAEHIVSLRNQQKAYPIYLTDLILTDAPEHVSTAYFLRHKRQLEETINATLTR